MAINEEKNVETNPKNRGKKLNADNPLFPRPYIRIFLFEKIFNLMPTILILMWLIQSLLK